METTPLDSSNGVNSGEKKAAENGNTSNVPAQATTTSTEVNQQPQEAKRPADDQSEPPTKKVKLDDRDMNGNGQVKGVAMIKKE